MDFQRNQFYHIISYGCQANVSDSEHYAGQLEALGYHHTEDLDMADVILVNTCCVRETAEDKTLGKIGEFKHLKTKNPDLIIAITGCMAQEWQDKLFKRRPISTWSSGPTTSTSSSSSLKSETAKRTITWKPI